ncbi:Wadjet anti-phage system protein JetA family protein [Hazenella coriacea]|uniref:Uncharacterized protein n=1 Tax=Hazenella coriacea TaxID=1179467 RepID=A0A4R3L850_9BACL|nr:Wadjet anti-phage system protein JetA family protein [Hazenella coriacea]TCS95732.1 hypothetical protein EDD58_102312 [Hazenella coriacea]
MKLFEVIPDRFFSILANQNRQLYAEALLLLYDEYQRYKFGIRYDVIRDLFQELIETHEELGMIYEEEASQESLMEDSELDVDRYRSKAGILLRRLRNQGWIDIEQRENFLQYIVLPHYSSRILAVLKDLCEVRTVEYQRFAFSTYQLLTGDEAKNRPCFALLEAEKMNQQFLEELRVLINNMKHHMGQVISKNTIQDVLSHHFDEYKAKIVDRSYHRLKTSDHVARYRSRIQDRVQKWLLDKDLLEETIMDGLRNEIFPSREEAEKQIRKALHGIEEVYRDLDEMFYQIDLRHNQYLRASFDRARYLSQHSYGINQQLVQALECVSKIDDEKSIISLSSVVRMIHINQLNEQSLLTPRTKRPTHSPTEHVVIPISEELKQKLRQQNILKMEKSITRGKIREHVLSKLGDRNEMGIVELAPQTVEEFLYLAYTYLYGYDGLCGFRLVRGKENQILQINHYQFHDRLIVRV